MNLATGASVLAAAAAAFSATPAIAQDSDEEAIIVTGSRIPQPNLYTTSPVTQVTAEDVQTQGVTRMEDLTNELPQVFAAQGSNISNGATGTAEVDLRGLGPDRTLVLINGRRMGYGSPNSSASDLNQIPGAIVERVEVLTGGASAVYGSDAVAGVVNFILTDDFEGLRMDAQYGLYMHSNDYDGPGNLRSVIASRATSNPQQFRLPDDNVSEGISKEVTAIFGASTADDRGNVTAYAGYRRNDAILQSQYDYSACTIGTSAAANAGPNFACGGSYTSAGGAFSGPTYLYTLDTTIGDETIGSGGFRDFSTSSDLYNYGPINYYQRPDERYTLGAIARYEIGPHVEAYAQLMYSDYRSDAQIAPSGNFGNTNSINCVDNILMSPSQYAAICESDIVADIADDPATEDDEEQDFIDAFLDSGGTMADALDTIAASLGTQSCMSDDPVNPVDSPGADSPEACPLYILRHNVEGGGRDDDLRFQTERFVTGVRGSLADDWRYDVSASYYNVHLSRVYRNELSVTRLARALDVIAHPVTGEPVCRSVVNGSDSQCVPYNVFSPNGVSAEALRYLQVPFLQQGDASQQNVIATITGELGLVSPMAETPIATSFGVEYRRDALTQVADPGFQAGRRRGSRRTNPATRGVDRCVRMVWGSACPAR